MQRSHFIDVIYTHTEGEPTCIVHSGIPYPAGLDILAKANSCRAIMISCGPHLCGSRAVTRTCSASS